MKITRTTIKSSKKITADKDVECLDNGDTIRELIDELAEDGVDIYDDQDILQELGANYGYDREDQFAILKDIREYVGEGINSAEEVDNELEDDFDERWDAKFGEPTTEVFVMEPEDEFEEWWKEVINFE